MANTVTIRVTLDGKDAEQGIQRVKSALNDFGRVSVRASGSAASSFAEAERAALRHARQVELTTQRHHQQQQLQAERHANNLTQIAQSSSARVVAIDRQRDAQLSVLRTRQQQDALRHHQRLQADEQRHQRRLTEIAERERIRQARSTQGLGDAASSAGRALSVGLTLPLGALAAASIKSAVEIDKNVNVLKAFVGSAEAAEKRFAALVAIAQKTPGLTTGVAATLDAQLRVLNVSTQTIDKLLPAIGRLNAVQRIEDPARFVGNLSQLITQNFERQDLKELVGNSPLAGELIKQIFNVDSATNAKAIRESAQKLGITTMSAFAEAIGRAAETDPRFANITESIGTRFDKLRDRVTVALRPLGLALINALEPLVERAVPIIESLARWFDNLSTPAKAVVLAIGAMAAAAGPLLVALGSLAAGFSSVASFVGVLTGGAGLVALLPVLVKVGAVLAVVAAAAVALYAAWKTNFGGLRELVASYVAFVSERFERMKAFFREIMPLVRAAADNISRILGPAIKQISDNVRAVLLPLWETVKAAWDLSFSQITGTVKAFLQLLAGDFKGFRETAINTHRELVKGVGDVLANLEGVMQSALRRTLEVAFSYVNPFGDAGRRMGSALARGIAEYAAPGLRLLNLVRNQRDPGLPPDAPLPKIPGVPGPDVPGAPGYIPPPPSKPTGGKGKAGDTAAQLADALAQRRLAESKAALDVAERSLNAQLDLEKENYDLRLTTAREYFERRQKIETALFDIEEGRIRREIAAERERLGRVKQGSAEYERIVGTLAEKEARLNIIEIDCTETLRKLGLEAAKAAAELSKIGEQEELKDNFVSPLEENFKRIAQLGATSFERARAGLSIAEQEIRGQALRGLLTEEQARDAIILKQRQYREEIVSTLESQLEAARSRKEVNLLEVVQVQELLSQYRNLGAEMTRAESIQIRLARQGVVDYSRLNDGVLELLASQKGLTEIYQDYRTAAVERFFSGVDSAIDRLTKRLGVAGEFLNQFLKDLARLASTKILQQLFGLSSGGGGAVNAGGGGGGGGFFSNIISSIGNIFKPASGGSVASVVTPPFAGGSVPSVGGFFTNTGNVAATGVSSIARSPGLQNALNFGITAPISLSSQQATAQAIQNSIANAGTSAASAATTSAAAAGKFSLAGLKSSLGAAAPLIGLSLGASLGGQSTLGKILGGAGGALLGGAAGVALGAIGGAAGTFGAAAAAFLTNPITLVAAPLLLLGGYLLGKAKQRKQDERTADSYWRSAADQIEVLTRQVKSDQIDGASALQQAYALKQQAIDQINTIKTASVRESRLRNQIPDLQRVYIDPLEEAVKQQAQRRKVQDILVPTFAGGGLIAGRYDGRDDVPVYVSRGEAILNPLQQMRLGGPAAFAAAGVPGFSAAASGPGYGHAGPMVIELDVQLGITEGEAGRIVVTGARTTGGRQVIVNATREHVRSDGTSGLAGDVGRALKK